MGGENGYYHKLFLKPDGEKLLAVGSICSAPGERPRAAGTDPPGGKSLRGRSCLRRPLVLYKTPGARFPFTSRTARPYFSAGCGRSNNRGPIRAVAALPLLPQGGLGAFRERLRAARLPARLVLPGLSPEGDGEAVPPVDGDDGHRQLD
jgi:hypothetical protein